MICSKVSILLLITSFVCSPSAAAQVEPELQQLSEQQPEESVPGFESEGAEERPISAPAVTGLKAATSAGIMEIEWEFLQTSGEGRDEDVAAAVLPQLADWLKLYPGSEHADEAQLLKARLHLTLGDYKSAIVDLLKHAREYPDSKSSAAAMKLLSETTDKKADKKTKAAVTEIIKTPAAAEKTERLALLLEKLTDLAGEYFYGPVTAEFREFFSRFPIYAGCDGLQFALGNLHSKKEEYVQARLAYEKLIKVYPDSRFLVKAKAALGGVLADNIKDYNAAITVYQDIAVGFPGTDEAWRAYTQLARLSERQKQYPLAVEVYEKIIALYPDKAEAYSAFKSEAGILREKISKPKEAVDVLNRLADKYKGEKAIEALYLAAEIARKDMKDLDTEVKMYDRIAAEYPENQQAPKAFLAAGQAYEKQKNFDKAREYYKKIMEKYSEDPLAKKAQKYFTAIENK